MLAYNHGYRLDEVRKLAKEGRIVKPCIFHHNNGYTFFFNVAEENLTKINCVLITGKGASPREFKKARTYTRVLKKNGIPCWKVKRKKEP